MARSLFIAVADANPAMLEFYKEVLPELGHQLVCRATTGAELVEQVENRPLDLVVADVQLSAVNGQDAWAEVGRTRLVPVVLVSAYYTRSAVERAQQDHVMSYLVKPVKAVDLEAAIAVALTRYGQVPAAEVPPPPIVHQAN